MNCEKFVEDLHKIYSYLIKTPPLTYYYGANLPLVLDYKESDNVGTAYIDLKNKNIHLSFKGLLMQLVSFAQVKNIDDLSKIDEKELSKMVRANLYHELSHAILTPPKLFDKFFDYQTKKDLNNNINSSNSFTKMSDDKKHSIVNIIEDERIETYMQDYYLSTNFEANKRLQPIYLEIDKYNLQCVNDFQSFLYRAVRFRKDKGIPKYDLAELSKLCNNESRVRNALYHLQRDIDYYFESLCDTNCFSNSFKDIEFNAYNFLYNMSSIYEKCRETFDNVIQPNLKQENKMQQQIQQGGYQQQGEQQDNSNNGSGNSTTDEQQDKDNKQGSSSSSDDKEDKDNSSNEGNSNKEDEEKKKQLEQVEKNVKRASEDKSNSFLDKNKDKVDTLDDLDKLDDTNKNKKDKSENKRKTFIEELAKRKVFGELLTEKINYFEKIFETAFISSKNNKDGYSYVRKNNIGAGKINPKLVAKPLISTQGKNFLRTSYVPNNTAIGGKKNLNIFIDASGSYSSNVKATAKVLEKLDKALKKHKNLFNVKLSIIGCSGFCDNTLKYYKMRPPQNNKNNVKATAEVLEKLDKALKKHKNLFNVKLSIIGSDEYSDSILKDYKMRLPQNNKNNGGLYVFEEGIKGYLNTFKRNSYLLSRGMSDINYKSLKEFKLNDRNTYNIVLIDGSSCFNDDIWDKQFNNSYFIVDSSYCSRLKQLSFYKPKFEQQVDSNDYPQKLEIVLVNVMKDICLSQNSVLTNLRSNKELELVR